MFGFVEIKWRELIPPHPAGNSLRIHNHRGPAVRHWLCDMQLCWKARSNYPKKKNIFAVFRNVLSLTRCFTFHPRHLKSLSFFSALLLGFHISGAWIRSDNNLLGLVALIFCFHPSWLLTFSHLMDIKTFASPGITKRKGLAHLSKVCGHRRGNVSRLTRGSKTKGWHMEEKEKKTRLDNGSRK